MTLNTVKPRSSIRRLSPSMVCGTDLLLGLVMTPFDDCVLLASGFLSKGRSCARLREQVVVRSSFTNAWLAAVVLLHGAGQSSGNLTRLARALSETFTVYVPDRRGRGRSGPYGDFRGLSTEIEDLSALLDACGATRLSGSAQEGLSRLRRLWSVLISPSAEFSLAQHELCYPARATPPQTTAVSPNESRRYSATSSASTSRRAICETQGTISRLTARLSSDHSPARASVCTRPARFGTQPDRRLRTQLATDAESARSEPEWRRSRRRPSARDTGRPARAGSARPWTAGSAPAA